MIAALFVAKGGPYFGLPGVDPWDESRDARKYSGPHRVIAHPPCERWGRYWSGGPSAKVRRTLGDDGGCFESAIRSVQKFGGVLEHPAHTHAWKRFGITAPDRSGWKRCGAWAWVCHVEQGHYGHKARKASWLYVVSKQKPQELVWGPSTGIRLDEGFHSAEERRQARLAGQKPIKRLSKRECLETPTAFRDALIAIAGGCEP